MSAIPHEFMKLIPQWKPLDSLCIRCGGTRDLRTAAYENTPWWRFWERWSLCRQPEIRICLCGEISVLLEDGQLRPATGEELAKFKEAPDWPLIRHALFVLQKRRLDSEEPSNE